MVSWLVRYHHLLYSHGPHVEVMTIKPKCDMSTDILYILWNGLYCIFQNILFIEWFTLHMDMRLSSPTSCYNSLNINISNNHFLNSSKQLQKHIKTMQKDNNVSTFIKQQKDHHTNT